MPGEISEWIEWGDLLFRGLSSISLVSCRPEKFCDLVPSIDFLAIFGELPLRGFIALGERACLV